MIALADCAVMVSDTREATRWWVEKMGFAVHNVGGSDHSVMVAPPGDKFVLHLCAGFGPVEPGNSGIAFMTDDIERQVARMQAAGVEFPEPLRMEAWGSIAKFADPDGNVFWLLGAPSAFVRAEVRRRAPGPTRATRTPPRRRPSSRAPRRGR